MLPGARGVSAGQSRFSDRHLVVKNFCAGTCGCGELRFARVSAVRAQSPSSPVSSGSKLSTDLNFCRQVVSWVTFARLEFVVFYTTPYIMLITECLAGSASGGVF